MEDAKTPITEVAGWESMCVGRQLIEYGFELTQESTLGYAMSFLAKS